MTDLRKRQEKKLVQACESLKKTSNAKDFTAKASTILTENAFWENLPPSTAIEVFRNSATCFSTVFGKDFLGDPTRKQLLVCLCLLWIQHGQRLFFCYPAEAQNLCDLLVNPNSLPFEKDKKVSERSLRHLLLFAVGFQLTAGRTGNSLFQMQQLAFPAAGQNDAGVFQQGFSLGQRCLQEVRTEGNASIRSFDRLLIQTNKRASQWDQAKTNLAAYAPVLVAALLAVLVVCLQKSSWRVDFFALRPSAFPTSQRKSGTLLAEGNDRQDLNLLLAFVAVCAVSLWFKLPGSPAMGGQKQQILLRAFADHVVNELP